MAQPPIGIDLGTTFSAVATLDDKGNVYLLPNTEGSTITPSAVYFENAENIIVGQVAKDARADNPSDVIEFVKRSMGTERKFRFLNQDFTPIDISAIVLRKLKQDAEAALGGISIIQAVVTCPAYFGAERRDATEKAAQIAGLQLLALINEPTAAAMAFGMGGNRKGTVLVFDLGGGTFDVTLLRFGADNTIDVLAVDGNHELGGKDFDDAIISIAIEQFAGEHAFDLMSDPEAMGELRQRAEKAKHDLTAREATTLSFSAAGHKTKFELTRKRFTDGIAHHIEGMRLTIMNILDEVGLSTQDIDDILMVGGSSRVPAVSDMVTSFFGKQPNTGVHPDEAVARGAALFASQIMSSMSGTAVAPQVREIVERLPSVRDIVPHSIGTTALWDDEQEHNSVILERGSKLDTPTRKTYKTVEDGQRVVRIDINEGEGNDLEYVQPIGGFDLFLTEPRPVGSPIDIEILLDKSGVIRVVAIDLKSGQEKIVTIDYSSNMKPEQVAERTKWLRAQTVK